MRFCFALHTGHDFHTLSLYYGNSVHGEKVLQIPAGKLGSADSHVPCQGAGTLMGELAAKIHAWILWIENDLGGDINLFAEYSLMYSDSRLMQTQGSQNFLNISRGNYKPYSAELLALGCAFYKGLSLYLGSGERYSGFEASLAYLYAAWQRYNLVKHLSAPMERSQPAKNGGDNLEEWEEELAAAHKKLAPMLEDIRFAQALRWLAEWKSVGYRSGALLREQLRLSLPLWEPQEFTEINFAKFVLNQPITAPGSFTSEHPDWKSTRLHHVFAVRPGAQTAVRALITDWLLPRYDIGNTLRLARLLRRNRPFSDFWHNGWWGLFTFFWLFLMVGLGTLAVVTLGGSSPEGITFGLMFRIAAIENILGMGGILTLAVFTFDRHALAHLALPRVIGGVFIGYAALVLEGDSLVLHNVLWSRGWIQPFMLWCVVMVVGFLYLYFDTRPLVRESKTAIFRAVNILLLSLAISMFIGLFTVAFITAMRGNCEVGFSSLPCFFGPIGWIDWKQWVSFVPLALFTGLVTQFIFEERTLTASVWSPEQE
jgi:hypothetical protein